MKTLIHKTPNVLLIFSLFALMACEPDQTLDLPAIFSDNMVLQQKEEVVIWGKATPGTPVTASGEWGTSASATTNDEGDWQLELPTIEAGGPYTLSISTPDTSIQFNNILLGEVWLASGQSNMEMPLTGWPPNDAILKSAESIKNSDNPDIRMFTVSRNVSSAPLNDITGSWLVSKPEVAGTFSATAYFFAQKINAELNVPVGIIHSSWGGTPIEAWVSRKTLSDDRDFSTITKQLKELEKEEKAYNLWLNQFVSISILSSEQNEHPFQGLDVFDEYSSDPETNTSDWLEMELPTNFEETEVGDIDGVVWFRKEIDIPESWQNKEVTVSLGPIDDMDVTYFNGEKIGGIEKAGFWQKERTYTIPAKDITPGKSVLAVKVIDHQGGGGIYGDKELLRIYPSQNEEEAISLAGKWKYIVTAQISGDKMYLFDPETSSYSERPELSMPLTAHTPTTLYNAMIAPLTPFTIKGTIWYQGETNVGRANQYIRLMKLLINDWRRQFNNEEMPFYYVQLAPWNYDNVEGTSSANLREAQRRSLSIPNTGMAVTLDIGNVENIHPANKIDVGKRLALWALAKDYEQEIPFSGPIPRQAEIRDNKVVIDFKYVAEGLKIEKEIPNQFEIAGNDGKFFPAKTEIKENSIFVSSPKVSNPEHVRYAYRNGAVASLFNSAGLPAPSFTTEEDIDD